MNIAPSLQRLDKQKQSLQYMHSYAVKDSINMMSLSEERPKWKEHKASDLLGQANKINCFSGIFLRKTHAGCGFFFFFLQTTTTIS